VKSHPARVLWLANPVIGIGTGWYLFSKFTLAPAPPSWSALLVLQLLYWLCLLPFLILCLEQVRWQSRHSVLFGLSLTLPMYLSFAVPWLADRGSFVWPFAVCPLSGAGLGPLGAVIGRIVGCRLFPREIEYPPLCARCGYSLRGLSSKRCPECGASTETWPSGESSRENGDCAKPPGQEDANGDADIHEEVGLRERSRAHSN